MSKASIAEHLKRWAGLPTLPPAVGASFPAMDGDIAELDELSERVFDGLRDAFGGSGSFSISYQRVTDDTIYETMRLAWGYPFGLGFRFWPDDRAAEQIAIWRYEIDHAGIAA